MIKSEYINLALNKANEISRRSGIGWAIVDGQGGLVHFDASMAGTDLEKLERSLRQHAMQVQSLFLTIEPHTQFYNIERLIRAIEESAIREIYVGHYFENSVKNDRWREWEKEWIGAIIELPPTPLSGKLHDGLASLITRYRPWVIGITSSDISGNSIPLSSLVDEFDFLNHLNTHVRSSRAILSTETQLDLLDFIPTENNAHEPLELFTVTDPMAAESILRHLASDRKFSVTLFSDTEFLAQMTAAELIDEVIFHLSIDYVFDESNTRKKINLKNWSLQSSCVVGRSNRMIFERQENIFVQTKRMRKLN